MCLIMKGKTKDILSLDLDAAWAANSDGAGIIVAGSNPRVIRGIMTLADLRSSLSNISRRSLIAVHLRLATHGSATPTNTHPHKINAHSYLMHNGILHGLGSAGHSGASDSAHLARILSKIDHTDRVALLRSLEGKYLYLHDGHISTYGAGWTLDRGVLLSNTYWQSRIDYPVTSLRSCRYYGASRWLEDQPDNSDQLSLDVEI